MNGTQEINDTVEIAQELTGILKIKLILVKTNIRY